MITQTVTNLSFVAAMYCVAATSDHYRDLYITSLVNLYGVIFIFMFGHIGQILAGCITCVTLKYLSIYLSIVIG